MNCKTLLLLLLFVFSGCVEKKSDPSIPDTLTGTIVSVSDGDSFKIRLADGSLQRIRLAFVDCPERGQDFYQKARQFSNQLIYNKEVSIRITDTDRYGRWVVWLYIQDATLNEELLKSGLAWHYIHFSDSENLQRLEDQARKGKIGIWSYPNPVPPWEFRRKKRTNP